MAELTAGSGQPGAPTVGDAFGWAARDPEWIGKVLLMGLIGLIPIVGSLQQLGWLLTMLDNLRAGRNEVPPAAFRYATRGVWLWLASLIYTIALIAVFYGFILVFVVATAATSQSGAHGNQPNPLAFVFFPLVFIWISVVGVLSLALWVLVPAIIEFTDRRGLGGAFDIPRIVRAVTSDPQHNLAAAGLLFVAYIIAGIGTYLCWVGVIFTAPYALTVAAGILRWYEVSVKPEALPPPSAASAR